MAMVQLKYRNKSFALCVLCALWFSSDTRFNDRHSHNIQGAHRIAANRPPSRKRPIRTARQHFVRTPLLLILSALFNDSASPPQQKSRPKQFRRHHHICIYKISCYSPMPSSHQGLTYTHSKHIIVARGTPCKMRASSLSVISTANCGQRIMSLICNCSSSTTLV